MSNKPKISIIMPVFNLANELSRSIESVLNQTYKEIELIIVDDGSVDSSGAIIDYYASRYPSIIPIHRENGGVFSARLCGIQKASGDYVGFVDGDDYIEPNMMEILIENACVYDSDISHCGYQMVFPSGRVDLYYGTMERKISNREEGLIALLEGKQIEPGLWNKIYRKVLLDKLFEIELDSSIKINEDLLMNYYLFKFASNSVYDDRCLYHYMIRPNSAATSKVNESKLRDPIKVLHTILEDCDLESAYYDIAYFRLCRQLISLATMSSKENSSLIQPYKRSALSELRKNLKKILTSRSCCVSLKLMSLWSAILPNVYQLVHSSYVKIRGIDKKYSTE